MQKLRISIVQYLNTAPLVWGFTNGPLAGKYELSFTVPSQCAEALRTAAVDIAIIPAIEYQRIPGLMVLPDLAIASQNRVRSLLIVSKKPIEQVRSVALDRSSRSTQALTRILAAEHWKIDPEFFEAEPDLRAMLEKADAALLIGDPALRISIAIEKKSTVSPEGRAVCQADCAGYDQRRRFFISTTLSENGASLRASRQYWHSGPRNRMPLLRKCWRISQPHESSDYLRLRRSARKPRANWICRPRRSNPICATTSTSHWEKRIATASNAISRRLRNWA